MWQEAKRQERKIRGILIDYRKRADRRKEYYDRIKLDPTQFLQIHGRQCKIYLDQNLSSIPERSVMVPWKDDKDNLIDRFDVRAHLDQIPDVTEEEEDTLTQEERHLNYERYRIIAQNSYLGISEEKCLKQLNLEEQFGYNCVKYKKGATIGFNYEENVKENKISSEKSIDKSEDDDSNSDFDVDLAINVSKMDPTEANEMNKHGCHFGMSSNDFYSFLINDLEEAETLKMAREEEQEKALYAGRKSRRERRCYREKLLAHRNIGSPSYAAKASPKRKMLIKEEKSKSRSSSPENCGKITYITSFGSEDGPTTSRVINKIIPSSSRRSRSKEKNQYTSRNRFNRSKSRSVSRYRKIDSPYRKYNKCNTKRSTYFYKNHKINSRYRYRSTSSSASSRSKSSSTSSSRSRQKLKSIQRSKRLYSSSSSIYSSSSIVSKSSSDPIEAIMPRYYGRNKNDSTSSDISNIDESNQKIINTLAPNQNASNKSIVERLKRKRQALLNRQFNADKKAAKQKKEREVWEQRIRDSEIKEAARKLRIKQREKRQAMAVISSDEFHSSLDSDDNDNRGSSRRDSKKYREFNDEKRSTEFKRNDYRSGDRCIREENINTNTDRCSKENDRDRNKDHIYKKLVNY